MNTYMYTHVHVGTSYTPTHVHKHSSTFLSFSPASWWRWQCFQMGAPPTFFLHFVGCQLDQGLSYHQNTATDRSVGPSCSCSSHGEGSCRDRENGATGSHSKGQGSYGLVHENGSSTHTRRQCTHLCGLDETQQECMP